ncbi:MAG: oxidoreductase [Rubellimicrobium sp.]|nr:oxidoreductase [Rubellimicrobium sp.]
MRALLAIGTLALVAGGAVAGEVAPPSGPVLLTVSGDIAATNDGDTLALDLAALEALPQTEFTTSTIWTDGPSVYTGVLLADLIDATGAGGSTITFTALNDYQVTMPMDEVTREGPLLAYLENGATMPVRLRGPIWVIYPFDDNADFRTEQTYARAVWQLDRIDFAD